MLKRRRNRAVARHVRDHNWAKRSTTRSINYNIINLAAAIGSNREVLAAEAGHRNVAARADRAIRPGLRACAKINWI